MKQPLNKMFASLLDRSGCLGIGLLDRNGLLIQSSGEHEGLSPTLLAALFAAFYNPSIHLLERALAENLEYQILLGKKYHVHLSRINRRYTLYALASPDTATGKVRSALKQSKNDLEAVLKGEGLFTPSHQGLKQPRQFANSGLVGASR